MQAETIVNQKLRQCKTCLQEKALDDFYKSKEGAVKSRQCKACTCARTRKYASERKEKYAEYGRNHRKQNPEAAYKASKKWNEANREKRNKIMRNYRANNSEYHLAWSRDYLKKRLEDPSFRAVDRARTRLKFIMRGRHKHKASRKLLGCSPAQLRAHLESLWLPGMSWDNYGLYGWHIDHKIPCSAFDLTQPAQVEQCFHYTNLQPLWAEDNLRKGGV